MLSVSHTVHIDLSVEDVYAYLVDVGNHPEWHGHITGAEVQPPGALRVGSEVHYTAEVMGRVTRSAMRVEGLIPYQTWLLRSTNDAAPVETAYHFEPSSESTRLTIRTSLYGGYPPLARDMVQTQMEKTLREQAARIKSVLEQRSTTARS